MECLKVLVNTFGLTHLIIEETLSKGIEMVMEFGQK
jgi:hypothetical protein